MVLSMPDPDVDQPRLEQPTSHTWVIRRSDMSERHTWIMYCGTAGLLSNDTNACFLWSWSGLLGGYWCCTDSTKSQN